MLSYNLIDCLLHSQLWYKEDMDKLEQVQWMATMTVRGQSTCSEERLRDLVLLSLENKWCLGGLNGRPPVATGKLTKDNGY